MNLLEMKPPVRGETKHYFKEKTFVKESFTISRFLAKFVNACSSEVSFCEKNGFYAQEIQ